MLTTQIELEPFVFFNYPVKHNSGKQLYLMTKNKYPPKWVQNADHNNFREKVGVEQYMVLLSKFFSHCNSELQKRIDLNGGDVVEITQEAPSKYSSSSPTTASSSTLSSSPITRTKSGSASSPMSLSSSPKVVPVVAQKLWEKNHNNTKW